MVQRQRTIRAAFNLFRQLCNDLQRRPCWIFAIRSLRPFAVKESGWQMKKDRWTALRNGVGLFRSGALGAARIAAHPILSHPQRLALRSVPTTVKSCRHCGWEATDCGHGALAVNISILANGALGEHRRHYTDGIKLEIAPQGADRACAGRPTRIGRTPTRAAKIMS
jgi:hypothetical protein